MWSLVGRKSMRLNKGVAILYYVYRFMRHIREFLE